MKRLTKRQREAQELAYTIEMDAIDAQRTSEEERREASDRAELAKYQRTHGCLFQDSYGDPVIHVPNPL